MGASVHVKKSISIIMVSALLATGTTNAGAQSSDTAMTERERIMAEIDKDIHNKQFLEEAMRRGKDRSILCGHCHGVDGNSVKPDIPNLAGQNPAYIIEQIGKFTDGTRKNFVMQTLASDFTFQDKVNLAVYFTSQKLKPVEGTNPLLASKGEHIYKSVCFRCHGADGRGEEGYSRLAGQQIEYVKMTLKRFRAAANTKDHSEDKRRNASMEQVTARLSDDDIEGLANYLALLK